MLVSRGQLAASQLQAALEAQSIHGGRLGSWLQKLGYATEHQLTAMLGLQFACPVMPVVASHHLAFARILPLALLTRFRMLPVWHVPQSGKLVLAFSQGIDYAVLNTIAEMLDCHPEPCLLAASKMDLALAEIGQQHRADDVMFEGCNSAYEMARIVSGYVLKLNAQQVRLAFCGEFLWARLTIGPRSQNLLFHRTPKFENEI